MRQSLTYGLLKYVTLYNRNGKNNTFLSKKYISLLYISF